MAFFLVACSDRNERSATGSGKVSGPLQSAPSQDASTATVRIGDFRFEPQRIEVKVGTAVVWRNTHNQAHTSTGAGAMRWNTGNIAPGAAAAPVTFSTPGTYPYFCALHPFMKGTVVVRS